MSEPSAEQPTDEVMTESTPEQPTEVVDPGTPAEEEGTGRGQDKDRLRGKDRAEEVGGKAGGRGREKAGKDKPGKDKPAKDKPAKGDRDKSDDDEPGDATDEVAAT